MRIKDIVFNRAARIGTFLMMAAVLLGHAPAAHAAAGNNGLKIYEVAGAGGLAGATYRQDTIILFNPTQATISCTTCAIQTHSGTSTTSAWTVYKLPSLAIPAGGYYMIAGSSQALSSDGSVAPIVYDYELQSIELNNVIPSTQNILSSTVGVVALTNTQKALTAGSSPVCGSGSQLQDLIGYGSNIATNSATTASPASCYAGSGEAYYDGSSAYGRQLGATRKNKCVDTFDNANDYVNAPITYFNSSSPVTVCSTGAQLNATISATPNNPFVNGEVTLTAAVTGASSNSGLTVSLDFNTPYYGGSSALQMYDDGTHGDAVPGDGTYTLATTIPASVVGGFTYPANVTASDMMGDSFTGSTPLAVTTLSAANRPSTGNNSIRIIAWYGAGDLSKSEYGRDTVILFNPSQSPITMNNWSLQNGGATGDFSAVTYLLPVVTIPAGGFYAIAGSGTGYISSAGCVSNQCNLNYPYDYQLKTLEGTETSTDNDLSSTETSIALVNNQEPLGTGCPITSANLVDLIGIGAVDGSAPVTCYEGSGYAPYLPSTLNGATTNINGVVYAYATIRNNKCGNASDNANDFSLGYIDFANSSTTPEPCPLGTQLAVSATTTTPSTPGILDPFTITTQVAPASTPQSTSLNVIADLSNLGLSTTSQLYDDGTHGDAVAGDHTYTLATAATSGSVGLVPGLIVTATDAQGNVAHGSVPLTLAPGVFTMTSPTNSGTVTAGGVLTFPITITGQHGYGGILNITCAGTPNANSLGVPISTQCVTTPPELTLNYDGASTVSLAIATGTTKAASVFPRSLPLGLIGIFSIGLLAVGIWRRKHLTSTVLLGLVMLLTFNLTACGTSAGLGNTAAAPGTYTYTVTATDSVLPTITNSISFTVTVQ
jgi:hypothetical protein